MSNILNINEEIYKLACAIHGLENGDIKALNSYEMIKKFIEENYKPKYI